MSGEVLFDHEPVMTDLHQGHVGDCFFIAAVSSVIAKDPESIKRIMRDNGDGTVTVCFHARKTVRQIEMQQRWGGRALAELTPRERIAFACCDYEPTGLESSALNNLGMLMLSADAESALVVADQLLAADKWIDKEFMPTEDETLTEHLTKSLIAFDKEIINDEMPQLEELQNLEYPRMMDRRTVANLPDSNTEEQTLEFITVKKEISVFEKGISFEKGSPAYVKGPLWAQMLEKAYGVFISDLEHSGYEKLDEGGDANKALEHLTGRKENTLFNFSGAYDEDTDSDYSIAGRLKQELAVTHGQSHKDRNIEFAGKLKAELPVLQNAPESSVNQLVKMLDMLDKKNEKDYEERI